MPVITSTAPADALQTQLTLSLTYGMLNHFLGLLITQSRHICYVFGVKRGEITYNEVLMRSVKSSPLDIIDTEPPLAKCFHSAALILHVEPELGI